MKKNQTTSLIIVASAIIVPAAGAAGQSITNELNRLSFSARFGLNISAKFGPRLTPDGASYNYIDGYVLRDVSGDAGNQTWNWGYDDSSRQVDALNNNILLTRLNSAVDPTLRSFDGDPNLGAEMVYNRELGTKGKWHYGLEAAANWMNLDLNNRTAFTALGGVIDAYPYTPGTTPPLSPTPTGPFQGTFNGPNFVIGDTPVGSTPTTINYLGQKDFNADLWGFRLGPYLEYPLTKKVNLWFSGGFAFGLLDSSASWKDTYNIAGSGIASSSGHGSDFNVLWGGYLAANVSWQLSEHWSAQGGVQYQNLGTYDHIFGGRRVSVDFSDSFFVTIGLGYSFK